MSTPVKENTSTLSKGGFHGRRWNFSLHTNSINGAFFSMSQQTQQTVNREGASTWHHMEAQEAVTSFKSHQSEGLSTPEAKRRLQEAWPQRPDEGR